MFLSKNGAKMKWKKEENQVKKNVLLESHTDTQTHIHAHISASYNEPIIHGEKEKMPKIWNEKWLCDEIEPQSASYYQIEVK